jgi:hypothetical protein
MSLSRLAITGNFIRQLLELTKLTSVFEVHPTLDAPPSHPVDKRHDGLVSPRYSRSPNRHLLRADQPDRLALEGGG